MNERQRQFCQHYAKYPNATQAAISAGYSPKTAYSIGQCLLKKVEIKKYLDELQGVGERGRIAEVTEVKSLFSDILRDTEEKTSNRIRAGNTLLKSSGAFSPAQTEDETADNENEVKIMLPYSGKCEAITAYLDEEGNVVPCIGHEQDDLLIYLSQDEREALENYRNKQFTAEGRKNVI